jgi:hypothetical protein
MLSACIGAGLCSGELVALCAEDVASDEERVVVPVRSELARLVAVSPP